jgi:hypothetical protein
LDKKPSGSRTIDRARSASVSSVTICSTDKNESGPSSARAEAVYEGSTRNGYAPAARSRANRNIRGPNAASTREDAGTPGDDASSWSRYAPIASTGFGP